MPTQLNIKLTSQEGITLNTEGKYCDKNIIITPQLEEDRVVTPTNEEQIITVSSGYAGIRSIRVEAAEAIPVYTGEVEVV